MGQENLTFDRNPYGKQYFSSEYTSTAAANNLTSNDVGTKPVANAAKSQTNVNTLLPNKLDINAPIQDASAKEQVVVNKEVMMDKILENLPSGSEKLLTELRQRINVEAIAFEADPKNQKFIEVLKNGTTKDLEKLLKETKLEDLIKGLDIPSLPLGDVIGSLDALPDILARIAKHGISVFYDDDIKALVSKHLHIDTSLEEAYKARIEELNAILKVKEVALLLKDLSKTMMIFLNPDETLATLRKVLKKDGVNARIKQNEKFFEIFEETDPEKLAGYEVVIHALWDGTVDDFKKLLEKMNLGQLIKELTSIEADFIPAIPAIPGELMDAMKLFPLGDNVLPGLSGTSSSGSTVVPKAPLRGVDTKRILLDLINKNPQSLQRTLKSYDKYVLNDVFESVFGSEESDINKMMGALKDLDENKRNELVTKLQSSLDKRSLQELIDKSEEIRQVLANDSNMLKRLVIRGKVGGALEKFLQQMPNIQSIKDEDLKRQTMNDIIRGDIDTLYKTLTSTEPQKVYGLYDDIEENYGKLFILYKIFMDVQENLRKWDPDLVGVLIYNGSYFLAISLYSNVIHNTMVDAFIASENSLENMLCKIFLVLMILTVILDMLLLWVYKMMVGLDVDEFGKIAKATYVISSVGFACGFVVTLSVLRMNRYYMNKLENECKEYIDNKDPIPMMRFFFNLTTIIADIGAFFIQQV